MFPRVFTSREKAERRVKAPQRLSLLLIQNNPERECGKQEHPFPGALAALAAGLRDDITQGCVLLVNFMEGKE